MILNEKNENLLKFDCKNIDNLFFILNTRFNEIQKNTRIFVILNQKKYKKELHFDRERERERAKNKDEV